jgi:hypothetical protein
MASITSTWRTKLSPPHKFTFRGLANLYLAGTLLPTTVYNTTSNCIHKLSHNMLHVGMLLSKRPCFTKSQQAPIEGPHKWGCRNFEFQHQVFFKCSKTRHKLGGLGVLCSKPYRKMHTDVRFSTSFSSSAAKHKANLVGWAYCVQKHIENAQCCALSCVF